MQNVLDHKIQNKNYCILIFVPFIALLLLSAESQKCVSKIHHHNNYMLNNEWRFVKQVANRKTELSKTGKVEEVKEQIRMQVLELGWDDLHYP